MKGSVFAAFRYDAMGYRIREREYAGAVFKLYLKKKKGILRKSFFLHNKFDDKIKGTTGSE